MTARPDFTADIGRHLTEEITALINRHARQAEGGGASVLEWSAVMMMTTQAVALQSIGTVLLIADERRREALFDETVAQLVASIHRSRSTVLGGVNIAEAVAGL